MKLMKSFVFHKKYLLAGIYIIFVLFTCCNSRFYHTPLAKICSVTEKQTLSREGTRGSKEYYYTQNITARILNGSHKGEKITVSNEYTSSQVQTKKYHKGDTVLLSGSKESPGKTIRSVKRDGYLALLAGGLFFLLICITGKQGFYTIISLILNTSIQFLFVAIIIHMFALAIIRMSDYNYDNIVYRKDWDCYGIYVLPRSS